VELLEQIRKVREREGASIHELARRFRIQRRTAPEAPAAGWALRRLCWRS
jgi:hypothetical protein